MRPVGDVLVALGILWVLGTVVFAFVRVAEWTEVYYRNTSTPKERHDAAVRVLWAPLWPAAAVSWLWIMGDEFIRDLRSK